MLVKSQVKYIQSLGHKKFRDQEGVFAAEGPKLIKELLHHPSVEPLHLYASAEWMAANRLALRDPAIGMEITENELARISFLTTPNEVMGIFKKPVFPKGTFTKGITLVLDNIQDPGNLGTIVRTADWFGIYQIVCSEDTADAFNPKVVQATMGSIARVNVEYININDFLRGHDQIPSYATVIEAKHPADPASIKNGFIVIGNESKGINPSLLSQIPHRITIPRRGEAESLNAAVAAGIVLSMIS